MVALILQSLVILISPLYIVRDHIFIPTTLLEILLMITFLATFVDFFRAGRPYQRIFSRFDPLVLIFLVAATIAVTYSPDQIQGLGILKAYFYEPVIFFYCLKYTSSKYGSRYIIWSLLGTAVWLSLMGLLQKLTGQYSLAPYELAQGRISAVYNSANSLALFLGPIMVLSCALFLLSQGWRKLVYLLLFVFFGITLVWTRSRGGMIAEVVSLGVLVYAILAGRVKSLRKVWFLVPLGIILGVVLFLYQAIRTYNFLPATPGPYTQGDTLQIRYFIWAGTVNMLKDHPILGAGLNGFKTLYSNQYRLPQFQEEFQYPHNILLTFWTETGILGLGAFLLLLIEAFSLVIRNLLRNNLVFGAGLLGALSYLVIHGMVDVPYFKNDLAVEFWTLLALIESWLVS